MSSFRYYQMLASAAVILSARLSTRGMRRKSWKVLAHAFADVDLPDQAMSLDTGTARELRKTAARELSEEFENAARAARDGKLDEDYFANLAGRTNGLWRELAATSPQELDEVSLWQRRTAQQIIAAITAEHGLGRNELLEVLEQMASDIVEGNSRGEDILELLALAGVPRKEFMSVINGYLEA